MLRDIAFENFKIGMTYSYSRVVADTDVIYFSNITGDRNPLHLDENYAEESIFGKRVAHGMLCGSFFSTIFGSKFPGEGCVYLEQNLSFLKPIFLNDQVNAKVELVDIDKEKQILVFKTKCEVGDKVVIEGSAKILIPKKSKK